MNKYKKAIEAVQELFSDKEVSRQETINNLNNLASEIYIMIDALEADEKREKDSTLDE